MPLICEAQDICALVLVEAEGTLKANRRSRLPSHTRS